MFFLPSVHRHSEFRNGARAMAPLAPGVASWGLMTGVAMVKSGMSVTEALAMTFFVYAGSSQLASIPLIVAGAPIWVVLATGFCVNLRFVVFSLHLRPYLMHMPRWRRLVNGYLTADLSYALFTARYLQPAPDSAGRQAQEAYLAGGYFVSWSSWMALSVAGIALANLIPAEWGLGYAGVLCLVGILCSLANTRMRMLSAALAGASAIALYWMPFKLNIVAAIAIAVAACYLLEQKLLDAGVR